MPSDERSPNGSDGGGATPSGEGPLSVLLIESDPEVTRRFEECLREGPAQGALRHEESLEAGLQALREEPFDALAIGLGLSDSSGMEAVKAFAAAVPEVPTLALGEEENLNAALQAQEAGATEYLRTEGLTPALLGRTLRWAVRRDQMQAKLRQRDAWIRSITESISAGVFRTGPTGRIEYANETLAEMLGLDSEEELVGRDLTEFYADPVQKGRMLVEEGASEMEVRLRAEDGSVMVGLLSAEVGYDQSGTPIHYDGVITDITERKRKERKLQVLSEAVEQAKEAILITEADPLDEPGPRVEYVNSAHEAMSGWAEEEIVGKTPRVLQGPETDRGVLDSLREALEAGKEWEGETVNYRKDGEPYRVQWNVSPVISGSGEVEHWVSVQRDVTEERRREEALRRQKRLLEQTQKLAGAWETDLRSEEVFWSEKAYEIHDLDPETELELEDIFGLLEPEARRRAREAFQRCAEEGEPYDLELPMVTAKGNSRWVRTVGAPAETDGDQVLKVAGALQDITDRKRYEQELEHYREYTDDILDAVDDVFYILGDEGYLERWNRSLLEVTGYSEAEIAQMHGTDFFAEEHAGKIADAIAEVFDAGDVVVEAPFQTKSGEQVPHEFVATLVEAPDGTEKLAGIGRDITDRRRREQDLKERQEKLKALYGAANRLLGASSEEEVAGRLVDLIRETLGYRGVSVRAAREGQLVPAQVSPETMEFMPERPPFDIEGESAVAEVYRTGETLEIEDLTAVEVEDPHDYGDLRSVVVVPMGEHGTFAVASPEPGAITAFDTHLIEVLGTYGAAVLDRIDREEELRETKNFYEQVLGQLPIELAVFSPEAQFEYVNPQGISDPERRERILGYTNEGYLRERGFDPEMGRRRDEAIREAAREGQATELEETLNTEEGPRHYLRVHGPVTGPEGEVTHVAGFGLEVTEQRERREQLKKQREYTDRLLNSSEDLFFVIGPDGQLRRWNDRVASVTGYSEEELSEMDVLKFFPDEEKERALGAITEVFETGRSKLETLLLTKEGKKVPYEFTGNQTTHPDGDLRLIGIGRDITERKRREEKLRRRDRRLEQIRKNITDVVWMSPADKSEIEFVSEAYEDIWGRSAEEVREDPSSVIEAIHPEDRARVRSAMEVQKRAPEEYEETYRVVQPGGEVRWVRDRASGVYDENGRLKRIIGVATDITEKKRHELRLETVNTRLQLALESTGTGTFDWDIETDEVVWDEESERLFGYKPGEFPGRYEGWANRVHSEDLEKAEHAIEQALESGHTYDVEFRVEPPAESSGEEERWVRARGDVQYDDEGRPTRMIGIHTDVTERKRREEALRDRQRKAEALYEATQNLLSAESPRVVSRRVHEVLEEVFGYDLSNTGFVDEGLIKPADVATSGAVCVPDPEPQPIGGKSVAARALRAGETIIEEDTSALDNEIDYGDLRSVAAVPIGERGVIVLGQVGDQRFDSFDLRLIEVLAGYGGSVLKRLENEQELVNAKEEAEEASRLKTALLANMSHEIRTPLTSITGFAEMLKENLEGKMRTFADRVYDSSKRLMRTLDSVLQLSRLEAGAYDLEREPLSLGNLIQETAELLRLSAEEKNIDLQTDVLEEIEGEWNEGALSRVLENLLENAIKFTPEGGRVQVRVREEKGEAVLEVEDSGIGISEEAQEEIFRAFKQESEGMDREYEGTGLGLSIVRRLVEAHGGSIEVESKKGAGSCFIVRLPRGKNPES